MKNITEYVMKLWHVMKHSFAPNPDLEICPPLRRSQNCRWGRQTQPGKSVAINKEQRAYSDPCLFSLKVKVTTFPTCWQKCDLGWLGWLWPGPSSQMEDVIICEACLEVARARPWLHQQLSTAHNSNNTNQTVAGWEVERRGLLTFNQVQTNKYLDIKYLNILYVFSTVRFPQRRKE